MRRCQPVDVLGELAKQGRDGETIEAQLLNQELVSAVVLLASRHMGLSFDDYNAGPDIMVQIAMPVPEQFFSILGTVI